MRNRAYVATLVLLVIVSLAVGYAVLRLGQLGPR
jgi:hypothetical protein